MSDPIVTAAEASATHAGNRLIGYIRDHAIWLALIAVAFGVGILVG